MNLEEKIKETFDKLDEDRRLALELYKEVTSALSGGLTEELVVAANNIISNLVKNSEARIEFLYKLKDIIGKVEKFNFSKKEIFKYDQH